MFTAKLEAKAWKKIISAFSGIVDEINITATTDKLKATSMDPSHICMVDFNMGKEHFEEYVFTEEAELGIDVQEMKKILNRSKPDEMLYLEVDENQLTLIFQKKDTESIRKFVMPLISIISGEKYRVPALQPTAVLTIPSWTFNDAIKDAYLVSDHVTFEAEEDVLRVSADGNSGMAETQIREWISFDFIQTAEGTYNLSYLADIGKSIEDEVTIDIGTDLPLMLSFTLDGADFMFILAPRVEREE